MIRAKESMQHNFRAEMCELTKGEQSLKKILRMNEIQQEIEVLSRQIFYLNEKVDTFILTKNRWLELKEDHNHSS